MELIDLRFKDPWNHAFREKVAGPFLVTYANGALCMNEFHRGFPPLHWILTPEGNLRPILKTDGR